MAPRLLGQTKPGYDEEVPASTGKTRGDPGPETPIVKLQEQPTHHVI